MSKELNILISGQSGSGKSVVAAAIAAILVEGGFDVTLDDPDVEVEGLIEFLGVNFKEKMDALKAAGLHVLVETLQTQREAHEHTDVQTISH